MTKPITGSASREFADELCDVLLTELNASAAKQLRTALERYRYRTRNSRPVPALAHILDAIEEATEETL